jgi:chemotaxis protein MotB
MAPPPAKGGGRRIVKKKGGGHGHHGGAWKVAYADFVTAMMALFMVLWLLASSDKQTRNEIANYFRTGILPEGDLSMGRASQFQPSIIEESGTPGAPQGPQVAKADAVKRSAQRLRDAIASLARSSPQLAKLTNQVTVKVTEDGILIEAADQDDGPSMLFDIASPELKPALIEFLERLAPTLAEVDGDIELHGHTDARRFPQGSKRNNWTLSFERAEAARRVLEVSGMPAGRLDQVVAHGPTELLLPDKPLAAQNRRLSLLVKPRELKEAATAARRGSRPAPATPASEPAAPPLASPPSAAPAPRH